MIWVIRFKYRLPGFRAGVGVGVGLSFAHLRRLMDGLLGQLEMSLA